MGLCIKKYRKYLHNKKKKKICIKYTKNKKIPKKNPGFFHSRAGLEDMPNCLDQAFLPLFLSVIVTIWIVNIFFKIVYVHKSPVLQIDKLLFE
jgi:hypothetical protein